MLCIWFTLLFSHALLKKTLSLSADQHWDGNCSYIPANWPVRGYDITHTTLKHVDVCVFIFCTFFGSPDHIDQNWSASVVHVILKEKTGLLIKTPKLVLDIPQLSHSFIFRVLTSIIFRHWWCGPNICPCKYTIQHKSGLIRGLDTERLSDDKHSGCE